MQTAQTYRLKAYIGKLQWIWTPDTFERCREIMATVSAKGIENRTKGGTIKITPPWCITRFEISPVRQRRARVAQSSLAEVRQ